MNQRLSTDPVARVIIRRWDKGTIEAREDSLVREYPLTIYLNEQEMVTLLCSPNHLEELAVGFLSSEGLIKKAADIDRIEVDGEKGLVYVHTKRTPTIAEKTFMKRFITTGCGKGTTFYNVMDANMAKPRIESSLQVNPEEILERMKELQVRSELYKETGGVHSAALCTPEDLLIYREDVGRHNAADKIIGYCFQQGMTMEDKFLLTSGRISSEILLKAAKMGLSMIASRSAPTDLAIQLAEEIGMTVIGFARGLRMNIYSHPQRVVQEGRKGL